MTQGKIIVRYHSGVDCFNNFTLNDFENLLGSISSCLDWAALGSTVRINKKEIVSLHFKEAEHA